MKYRIKYQPESDHYYDIWILQKRIFFVWCEEKKYNTLDEAKDAMVRKIIDNKKKPLELKENKKKARLATLEINNKVVGIDEQGRLSLT